MWWVKNCWRHSLGLEIDVDTVYRRGLLIEGQTSRRNASSIVLKSQG